MLAIHSDKPDPKMCLEIGAAILLDKPIILCVRKGLPVPENLRKIAKLVEIEADGELSELSKGRVEDAIYDTMTNDQRSKRPHNSTVEHLTSNQRNAGSSPAEGTKVENGCGHVPYDPEAAVTTCEKCNARVTLDEKTRLWKTELQFDKENKDEKR